MRKSTTDCCDEVLAKELSDLYRAVCERAATDYASCVAMLADVFRGDAVRMRLSTQNAQLKLQLSQKQPLMLTNGEKSQLEASNKKIAILEAQVNEAAKRAQKAQKAEKKVAKERKKLAERTQNDAEIHAAMRLILSKIDLLPAKDQNTIRTEITKQYEQCVDPQYDGLYHNASYLLKFAKELGLNLEGRSTKRKRQDVDTPSGPAKKKKRRNGRRA